MPRRPDLRLPPPPERMTTISHQGRRFLLGYDATSFVVRDAKRPGAYSTRFPLTEVGWTDAWEEFRRKEAWHRPGWPKRGPWIVGNVVIGLIGVSFVFILVLTGITAVVASDRLPLHAGFVFPASTVAFLLLIYLRRPMRTRVLVFALVLAAASVATVATSPLEDDVPSIEELMEDLN